MSIPYPPIKSEEKFSKAQRQAFIQDVIASLFRQHPHTLLSYDEVRLHLKALDQRERGRQMIPLDKIVGSVGRYRDFTREFLPRAGANRERWKWLDQAVNRLEDLPPIQVYQLGDAYFVKDGHHRISVALANGATHIEAIVTEVRTRVPFTPDMDPSDFILQEEYANFLEHTRLDTLRPDQRIELTIPGRYDDLIDHIAVHRYYLGIEQNREVPYEEAVTSWYDHVYQPAIQVIRRERVLHSFPGRTEADLYVWLMQHLYYLREEYGDTASLEQAAAELVQEEGEKLRPKVIQTFATAAEVVKEVIDKITPL